MRDDLAAKEEAEIEVLKEYLPEPLERGCNTRSSSTTLSPPPARIHLKIWVVSWRELKTRAAGKNQYGKSQRTRQSPPDRAVAATPLLRRTHRNFLVATQFQHLEMRRVAPDELSGHRLRQVFRILEHDID